MVKCDMCDKEAEYIAEWANGCWFKLCEECKDNEINNQSYPLVWLVAIYEVIIPKVVNSG